MSVAWTEFEKWALSIPVPSFALPALVDPSDEELWRRAVQISYDLFRDAEGEKGLASILVQIGALDYLEKSPCL